MSYQGNVPRGSRYKIMELIMNGKIVGRRGVVNKQISWLKILDVGSLCRIIPTHSRRP